VGRKKMRRDRLAAILPKAKPLLKRTSSDALLTQIKLRKAYQGYR
jgi:hypothetical protein